MYTGCLIGIMVYEMIYNWVVFHPLCPMYPQPPKLCSLISPIWKALKQSPFLVGGFNPFEKYLSNWIISPGRDKNLKNWNHHPVVRVEAHLFGFTVPGVKLLLAMKPCHKVWLSLPTSHFSQVLSITYHFCRRSSWIERHPKKNPWEMSSLSSPESVLRSYKKNMNYYILTVSSNMATI